MDVWQNLTSMRHSVLQKAAFLRPTARNSHDQDLVFLISSHLSSLFPLSLSLTTAAPHHTGAPPISTPQIPSLSILPRADLRWLWPTRRDRPADPRPPAVTKLRHLVEPVLVATPRCRPNTYVSQSA